MRKLSTRFPLENVLFWQRVLCTLLILPILFFSFGTLFMVPLNEELSDFFELLDSDDQAIFEKNGTYVRFDFQSAAFAIVKFIDISLIHVTGPFDVYDQLMENKDETNVSMQALGIAYLLIEAYDQDVTVLLYLSLIYGMTLMFPLVVLISLLGICTKHGPFSEEKDGHAHYKRVMRHMRRLICWMPIFALLISVAPQVRLGRAVMIISLICMLALLINAIAPYLKNYTKAQRKYARMLQCVSVVGIGFFVVFCVSLIRSRMMIQFVRLFDHRNLKELVFLFEEGNVEIRDVLSILIGFAVLWGLAVTCRSPFFNLCRIGFMTTRMKKEDTTRGDAYISKTLWPNIITFVYFLFLGSSSAWVIYAEEKKYFALCMASLMLMTLTEVLIVFLGGTLCVDLDCGGKDTVLQGTTYEAQIERHTVSRRFTSKRKKKKRDRADT